MSNPPSKASIKYARQWRRAMRVESQARQDYLASDEPRARERARKRWLSARGEFAKFKRLPSDDALRLVRETDRSDR